MQPHNALLKDRVDVGLRSPETALLVSLQLELFWLEQSEQASPEDRRNAASLRCLFKEWTKTILQLKTQLTALADETSDEKAAAIFEKDILLLFTRFWQPAR